MKQAIDIHNYEIRLKSAIEQVKSADISARNKKLIMQLYSDLVIGNISKPRLIKYLNYLKIIAQRVNIDFDKMTIDDVKEFIRSIQERADYSPWTKQAYKVILRKLFKWMKGDNKEYPPEVKWININIKRTETKLPGENDLLTEQEIKKMIDVATHPRDKALVSIIFESGGRIGEIASLQIQNVKFDKFGAMLTVEGKTGSRPIRIISSTAYLMTWMENHPLKHDKTAPLWVNNVGQNKHQLMHYGTIRMLFLKIGKRAGVNKRLNPHIFRHSRATLMANHLTEFQMNQYFGWIQGSDMPSTYVHMSGKNIDNAILQMNGLATEESKAQQSELKPMICPRCETINAPSSKFCTRCACILDMKTAMEMQQVREKELEVQTVQDDLMTTLMQDPKIKDMIVSKILELGLGGKLKAIVGQNV
ncbi:MAG: site-specific integrase [Candidatus Woesearchaeota archaeon]